MITAKSANKKTFESAKAKELLKEKHYLEVLQQIENKIINSTKDGCFEIGLKTGFMYPFRDKVINELTYNGYEVILRPATSAFSEYILINWK